MDTIKNIDFVGIILSVIPYLSMVVPFIFPLIMGYITFKLGKEVYSFVLKHQVIGESNEWVVIIRNGK